jgi:hypothetical protein
MREPVFGVGVGLGVDDGGVVVSDVVVEVVIHRDNVSSFTAVALSPPPQKFEPQVCVST